MFRLASYGAHDRAARSRDLEGRAAGTRLVGSQNWAAKPLPWGGRDTPSAVPGCALWIPRPVVPRDYGPVPHWQGMVAGKVRAPSLRVFCIPRVLMVDWNMDTGKPVYAGVKCEVN
ncbi:g11254 [Coccomyxa elongata]